MLSTARRIAVLFIVLLLGTSTHTLAQTTIENEITTARLLLQSEQITAGEPFWIGIELSPQPHWHSYWQNPGDSGMASTLQWSLPEGFEAGTIHWLAPERIEYSGLFNYGFEGPTALLTPITPPATLEAGSTHNIEVKASWLVCKDICIPEYATFRFTLTVAPPTPADSAEPLNSYLDQIPRIHDQPAQYRSSDDTVQLSIPISTATDMHSVWWFPIDDGVIANDSDQQWQRNGDRLLIAAKRGSQPLPDHYKGLLTLQAADGTQQHLTVTATHDNTEIALTTAAPPLTADPSETPSPATPPNTGLWLALLSALLGGIILNIMPCVLPILSLKALSVAKHAHTNPAAIRVQGLAYTLGILLTFAIIAGLLIGLQQAGQSVGWGFQLQSPPFVVALAYLLFLVGLNLSGLFHLPTLLGGITARTRNPYAESFFTGILATLLATPCTAPFMAAALGYAITQPPAIALAVFLCLGLGLALPYLLICFVPPLRRLLPKPGAWMVRFKELMAFPIYASVAWLLWVLVQQSGAHGLALALTGMVLIAFTIWLLPLLARRRAVQTIAFILLAAIIMWSIKGQSGDQKGIPQNAMISQAETFSQSTLDRYREQGRPVFVYGTAAWCITCKVNERTTLKNEKVNAAFAERNIAILRADWTNFDDNITTYLKSFGRNGVPIYVFYPPSGEPQLLPQILTPTSVIDATRF